MAVTTVPTVESSKGTEKTALITGSEAIAVACKLADVDVITAYPIRPYDTVMQYVAKLVADGEMDCEYIVAEGEHSQFEIVKHASAVGARVFCGSSGVGWMYAMEALTVTPALRIPMVAMVGNRALDDPGAFGVEHNDALAVRDLGWQLVWVDNAQEALDTALIAYRVAEDRRIFLPCAISCDGAFLTHSQALVKIPSQENVNAFLPRYDRGDLLLHPDNPISVAPQANEDWVMEIRRQNYAAMERSAGVIREAYADFERIFDRSYGNPFFEEYQTEDADVVLLGMGTVSIPIKVAIRQMRKEGKKVGLIRMRWFRPFAAEELTKSLSRFAAVGVIDRDYSFGSPYMSGVLATEVRSALYASPGKKPPVLDFIAGLGGREVRVPDVQKMTEAVYQAAEGKPQPLTQWIGLRE
ncbi:MAG: pyruvate ferredoxin oxidoreductase [Acidobacteria bacterium RIFCSPLOWO2_02_FULL_61_28]|nr:MAG: pyruvate ferredoxin oxidoreductase [Acidobacteria bacterium RIFCSPLOWO2_02_FULL_61_28]